MRASLIVGAGPGGIGALVWAAQNGKLENWLASGIALFDRQASIGGTLGRYLVNSDSLGKVYLECLESPEGGKLFTPLGDDPAARALALMDGTLPPLGLVDRYLHRLGLRIEEIITDSGTSEFHRHTTIHALHLLADGSVSAEASNAEHAVFNINARTAILALGGVQDNQVLFNTELAPGVRLADIDKTKIIPSDDILRAEGLQLASSILEKASAHRVVILGGSHSAFSVAWALTNLLPRVHFGPQEIIILNRRPPRIFYENRKQAEADGYDVAEQDICPRTGRVNRFGGLRGDGREIWRRLTLRPGTLPEDRVTMMPLDESSFSPSTLREFLDESTLIVSACGYRSATIPVFDQNGRKLILAAEKAMPTVGHDARILLADGARLPNVFGIGLGTGFLPWSQMGGEPNFDGQLNSLWLYQNDIGEIVYKGIFDYIRKITPTRPSASSMESVFPQIAEGVI